MGKSKRKPFSSFIYNKNISCFTAVKLVKATSVKVRWHVAVAALPECRNSCSIQELTRGDSSLHLVLYLPFSSGFNRIWVTLQYPRGWKDFRVTYCLWVLPGKAGKIFCPPKREEYATKVEGQPFKP